VVMVEIESVVGLPTDELSGAVAASTHRSPREWAAAVALGLMFLMVTKGPVYRIRFEAAPVAGDFIDDAWVQVAFVTIAAIVIALAWPGSRRLVQDRLVAGAFGAFLLILMASSLWSVVTTRTVEQTGMLFLGTTAALLAGAYVRRLDVLVAVWSAAQIGVTASLFADMREWPLAIDHNGDLAGIYFNRNSLGPVAVLGVVASLVLAVECWQRRSVRAIPALLVAVAFLDAVVWWRSGSLTPVFALVVASAVLVLVALFLPGHNAGMRRRLGAVLAALSVAGIGAVVVAWSTVADSLDRSTTFSGRTTIWDVVLDFVGDRPLQGWGFMAVWRRPEIIEALDARDRVVFEAHSGYLEVLLGVGVVGLLALIVVFGVSIARAGTALWRRRDVLAVFAFYMVLYAPVVNLGETYVGANLLPWILMSVMAAQSIVRPADPLAEVAQS
jgi:exopolysaccharide production protein ExoQ